MVKNILFLKLSLKQLIVSGIHIGNSKDSFNNQIKPYLFGYYYLFFIINLYYTNFQLKIILQLITKLTFLRQKLFFVKCSGFGSMVDQFSKLRVNNLFFYNFTWIGGFLTNFKEVRNHWLKKDLRLKITDKLKLTLHQRTSLTELIFFPSLIIFFDNYSLDAIQEVNRVDIPIVGIIDTNSSHLNLLNYLIVGNNSSYGSLFLYYNLFYNSIKIGLQKENFTVLSLK